MITSNFNFYADLDSKEFFVTNQEKTLAYGNFEIDKNKFNYKVFDKAFRKKEFYNYISEEMANLWREIR
jgi:hypothetical protein